MASTQCSECDEEIEVAGRAKLGQKVLCNHCGAQLEVVAIEPLEVEISSEDDDDLWDDEEDDDLDDLDEELDADGVKEKAKEKMIGKSAVIEELELEDDLDIEVEELEDLDDDELEEEDDFEDDLDFDDDDFEGDDLDDFEDDDDDNDRWR